MLWDGKGCNAAVNRLGLFDFSLLEDLVYSDDFRQINLSRGIQRVDGKKYVDMVTFPAFSDKAQRCDISSKLLAALLENRLCRLTDDRLAAGVLNLAESSITAEDRATMAPALKFCAGLPFTISYHVTSKTEQSPGGLILTERSRARAKKYFQ